MMILQVIDPAYCKDTYYSIPDANKEKVRLMQGQNMQECDDWIIAFIGGVFVEDKGWSYKFDAIGTKLNAPTDIKEPISELISFWTNL